MSAEKVEKELREIRIEAVKIHLRTQYTNQTTIQAEIEYLNYQLSTLSDSEKDQKLKTEYEPDLNSDKEKLVDNAKKISILEDLYRKLNGSKKATKLKL